MLASPVLQLNWLLIQVQQSDSRVMFFLFFFSTNSLSIPQFWNMSYYLFHLYQGVVFHILAQDFKPHPPSRSEGWLPCRKVSSSRSRTTKTSDTMKFYGLPLLYYDSSGLRVFSATLLMQTLICGWAGGVGGTFPLDQSIIYVAWTLGTLCIRAGAVLSTETRSRPPINGCDQGGKLHS